MPFQPKEEKDAERQLIINFARSIGAIVIKLQGYNDDGYADGIILYKGVKIYIEVRRKGFPNHKGKAQTFRDGWKTSFLVDKKDGGIFLNESTINNHKDTGFVFIVEIKGSTPRACVINRTKVAELLNQRHRTSESTNSGVYQSVKAVPLDWFKEF